MSMSDGKWFKSARSGPNCDNCVEVRTVAGGVEVRNSKDRSGPSVAFTADEWSAFVGGAKDGEFDLAV